MKTTFFSRRAFFLLLIFVFLVPLILSGARRAVESNKNDVKAWLPDRYEETAVLEWFRDHFLGEQFILVSWEGCTLDDPHGQIELLARKLVPPDLPELEEELVEEPSQLLGEARAFAAAQPVALAGGEQPILSAARNAQGELLFKKVITGPRVLAEMTDPDGSLKLSSDEAVERLKGSLVGPDGRQTCLVVTLTEAGKANLREVIGNARPLVRILMGREHGKLFQLADECAISREQIRLGGPPVDNVAIDDEGEITLLRLVGLSALVGLGVSYYCFRSWKLTGIVFSAGVYAAIMSMAIVWYSGGTVDAVLMSMPSVVYVLGLSGAIHLVNYYRDAIKMTGPETAPGQAVAHAFAPCTLAAITTAVGLGSLYMSDIVPIRKFGGYSAVAVLLTLFILYLFVPSMLQLFQPLRRKDVADDHASERAHSWVSDRLMGFADFVIRHNRVVATGSFLFMVVVAVGLTQVTTSVRLLKMFSSEAEIIEDYTWLENHLGNLVPMEVVVKIPQQHTREPNDPLFGAEGEYRLTFLDRMEMVDRIKRQIEALPEVGRALSTATFAPELDYKSLESFYTRKAFDTQLQEHRGEFLEQDYLRVDTGDGADLFRISARVAALSDVDYGAFVQELRDAVNPVLNAYDQRAKMLRDLSPNGESLRGKRVAVVGLARPQTAADEQPASAAPAGDALASREQRGRQEMATMLVGLLRGTGLSVTPVYNEPLAGGERVTLESPNEQLARVFAGFDYVYLAGDHDRIDAAFIAASAGADKFVDGRQINALAAFPDEEIGVEVIYTGVVPLVYKAQRELLTGLIESIALAFVLIALLMMVVLRSPVAGLLSMLPNMFPILVIFGMMGWMSIAVDIGTMMTASVALGVAVDDTVHFLTWFRRGLIQGLNRADSVRLAYERCATAMFQTSLIGGLGLGVFAFSTFTPTQRFGVLMVVLLIAALVGDLIFLPALLASPIGRFFCGKYGKKHNNSPQRNFDPPPSDAALQPVAEISREVDNALRALTASGSARNGPPKPHLKAAEGAAPDKPHSTFRQ